jgi:nicotinamidase/pyrazinamidase
MNHILIMVDLQNDFMPGGALAVPAGDEVIAVANAIQPKFEHVIATQDWHPVNHQSFAVNHPGKVVGEIIDLHGIPQILWPAHCIQNTRGAALVDHLDKTRIEHVIYKGTDPQIDSYSAFFDNGHRKETHLERYLHTLGASKIHILGLATDYCVKFTVFDALRLGFEVCVIAEGCRGIDLKAGDSAKTLLEMSRLNVSIEKANRI